MADTKKISELNSTSNLANEDEFVVIDKNGTGEDSSSSGKTSKIRFDALKTQIGSQGEKGEKGDANKGQKGEEGDKGLKGEPLEFTDLSSTQKNSLKGQKGEEGEKLTFNDLSGAERESLKGKKGEEGVKGLKGEPLEFTDLSSTQKNSLKGAPGPKLTFNDLSSTEKNSLKGQKGEANKGQKGEVDIWARAKNLWYWTGGASPGTSANRLYKFGGQNSEWDASVYSRHSYLGGAYVSFVPDRNFNNGSMYMMVGLNSKPPHNSNSYPDIEYKWYVKDAALHIAEGSNTNIRSVGAYTTGTKLSVIYDNSHVHYYKDDQLIHSTSVGANKHMYMDSSLFSPVISDAPYATDVYFGPVGKPGTPGTSPTFSYNASSKTLSITNS